MARSGVVGIFLLHLVPLVAISCIVEGLGLRHWGRIDNETLITIDFSRNDVIAFEGVQFGLSIFAVFAAAWLVHLLADTFQRRSTFTGAFSVVAYGLSPMFLFRMVDGLPVANNFYVWGTWIAGVGLSIWILYQGVPLIMKPDPSAAFGLYCSVSFVLLMITGLCRGLTFLYLLRNIHHVGHHLKHLLPGGGG